MKYGWFFTYSKQQLKAKMPAAGATQALRLFNNPLFFNQKEQMVNTKFESVEKLTKELSGFKIFNRSKTIFDIGGKGYFENPLTDLLAFFCDPCEEHGFGDVFLQALLKLTDCENLSLNQGPINLVRSPIRECHTKNHNRLDLVIDADEFVIVIENKVYAGLYNDFKEYTSSCKERFRGKTIIFILLTSELQINQVEGWVNITHSDLCSVLKSKIIDSNSQSENKWYYIVMDLLEHLSTLNRMSIMDKQEMDVLLKSYKDITNAIFLREEFHFSIAGLCIQKIQEKCKMVDFNNWKKENWGNLGIALRFKPWGISKDIVLVITPDGEFYVRFYIYKETFTNGDLENALAAHLESLETKEKWYEQKGSILAYRMHDVNTIELMLNQFETVVERIDSFKMN